jgi:adenylylsulfate kinase
MTARRGFAVWITGLPSSGKSSVTGELVQELHELGVPVLVLESDEMRAILTPEATYSPAERDRFYQTLVLIGALATRNGINVIFDATANRRAYREHARSVIPAFIEAYIECPLEVCMNRDPKGIYGRARSGAASTVPGLQMPYEPPLSPEITLDCRTPADIGAKTILNDLRRRLYV